MSHAEPSSESPNLHLFRNHCLHQPKTKLGGGCPGLLPTPFFQPLLAPEQKLHTMSFFCFVTSLGRFEENQHQDHAVTKARPSPRPKLASLGWNSLLCSHSLSLLHYFLQVSEVPPDSAWTQMSISPIQPCNISRTPYFG